MSALLFQQSTAILFRPLIQSWKKVQKDIWKRSGQKTKANHLSDPRRFVDETHSEIRIFHHSVDIFTFSRCQFLSLSFNNYTLSV